MTRTVGAGHTLMFSGALAADQTVIVDSGTPSDPYGGVVEIATRATNNGTIDLLANPSHAGADVFYGATLQVTGTLTNKGAINLAGGAYGFGSAGPVLGALMQDQGVVTNLGSITVGASIAPPLYGSPGFAAALIVNGVLTNQGQVSLAGADGRQSYAGILGVYGGTLANSGTLVAQAGIDDGFGSQINVSGTLSNSGLISIAAGYGASGGVLQDDVLLTNTGRITINGPGGSFYSSGGTLYVDRSAVLDNSGVLTNDGTLMLGGSDGSYYQLTPGAYLVSAGDLINAGLLTVQGADGRPPEGTDPLSFGAGATLNNTGVLTNTGHLAVDACYGLGTGGVLIDAGSLLNSGTMTLYGGATGYMTYPKGATVDVTGKLTNTGLLSIDGGTKTSRYHNPGLGAVLADTGVLTNSGTIALAGGQLTDSLTLKNSGVITVAVTANGVTKGAAGLVVTAGGTLSDSGTISGAGELLNQGNIVATDGSDLTVASLVNNGTIGAIGGNALFIGSAISGTGSGGVLGIQSAATLTLAGSVQNQLVAFGGANSVLALGDTNAFAGILEGLQAAETIDFLSLDVTSAKASGTTLAIGEAGGTTLDLKLAAPLPVGTGLMLMSDQHGGTDLLVQAPGG